MKLSKKSQNFTPHPEYTGPGVCVDITPLKKQDTSYGPKEVFRVVFETKELREDGTPFCVWSRGFTPSLHEKAAFAQFLRKWMGRPLSAAEEEDFDTESLIGKSAHLTVVHEDGERGDVYANIALIRPDRSGEDMEPSGKYIRVADREKKSGNSDAQYRRADQGGEKSGDTDWRRTKVHVGKHTGLDLGDLDRASVEALIERWLPTAKAKPKPLADDRRLMAALESARRELEAEEDDIPMDDDNQPF